MATEVRSPHPRDHRAGLTIGRDGVVQVWQDGKRVGVVSAATAGLIRKALALHSKSTDDE